MYYCGDLETDDQHSCMERRAFPENNLHSPYVALMLGQCRRRWSNIKTAFGQCLFGVVSIV